MQHWYETLNQMSDSCPLGSFLSVKVVVLKKNITVDTV